MNKHDEKVWCLNKEHPLVKFFTSVNDDKSIITLSDADNDPALSAFVMPNGDDVVTIAAAILEHPDHCFLARKYVENNPDFKQVIPYTAIAKVNEEGIKFYSYQRVEAESTGEKRLVGKTSIGFGGHVSIEDFIWYVDYPANPVMFAITRELAEEVDLPSIDDSFTECVYMNHVGIDGCDIEDRNAYDVMAKTACCDTDEVDFIHAKRYPTKNELLAFKDRGVKYVYVQHGYTYDPTNEVGRVHLGMLGVLFILDDDIEPKANEEGLVLLPPKSIKEMESEIDSVEALDKGIVYENWSKALIWNLNNQNVGE